MLYKRLAKLKFVLCYLSSRSPQSSVFRFSCVDRGSIWFQKAQKQFKACVFVFPTSDHAWRSNRNGPSHRAGDAAASSGDWFVQLDFSVLHAAVLHFCKVGCWILKRLYICQRVASAWM